MIRFLAVAVLVSIAGCRQGARDVARRPAGPPRVADAADQDRAVEAGAGTWRLAYVTDDGGLYVRAAEEGETDWFVAEVGWAIDYSEDGSKVAYADQEGALTRVDLVIGDQESVASADEADDDTGVAISPDGSKVAYLSGGRVKVWAAAGGVRTIQGPEHCNLPAWSPDSERLAIGAMADAHAEEKDGGVWLWDGSGAAKQIVEPQTDDWGSSQWIMWSPDGEWLAWARGAGDGWTGDLARPDGSDLQRDVIGAGPIAWLPDSSGLLVSIHIEAGAFRVGFRELAQSKLTRFGGEYGDSIGCLSPDGTRALILSRSQDTPALLVELATGEAREWGPAMGAESATWGPDGIVAVAGSGLEGGLILLSEDGATLSALAIAVSPQPNALKWVRLP